VLYMGVRGVTDLMMAPGLVNLDFADIRTVMAEMGKAMMGTGEAEGENRAIRAAEAAISNPLLEDTSMAGARGLLINITGGEDLTLFEVDQAANRIREEVDEEANIIFGSAIDEDLVGKIRVSVVATGIDTPAQRSAERPKLVAVGGGATMAMATPSGQAAANFGIVTAPPPGMGQPAMLRPAAAPAPRAPVTAPRGQAYALHPAAPLARPAATPAAEPLAEAVGLIEPVSYADPSLAEPRPAAAPRAAARPAARPNPLFAAESPAAPAPSAMPPKRSLFNLVTGAIRGGVPLPEAAPAVRTEPSAPRETTRADVRQTAGDEMQIDIPAFLRRQSS